LRAGCTQQLLHLICPSGKISTTCGAVMSEHERPKPLDELSTCEILTLPRVSPFIVGMHPKVRRDRALHCPIVGYGCAGPP